jgi:hypothetical protein
VEKWFQQRNSCTARRAPRTRSLIQLRKDRALFERIASDRMKSCYDRLAKSAGFQENDQAFLLSPTTMDYYRATQDERP